MNKQEIIDIWMEGLAAAGGVPQAAYDYVMGDDSKLSQIQKCNRTWMLLYNKKIAEELSGEHAETARRCLRANAAMRGNDYFITNEEDFSIAARIGFTLDDILKCGFRFFRVFNPAFYIDHARELLSLFPEQAEKLITADYLEKNLSASDKLGRELGYFIAAELVKRGVDHSRKLFGLVGKSLSDAVYSYAQKNGVSSISVCILSVVYKTEERFAVLLRDRLSYPDNVRVLSNIEDYKDNYKEVMEELGLHEEYLLAASSGLLPLEMKKEADEELVNNEELLLKLIGKTNKISSAYAVKLSEPLMVCLEKGTGHKCLEAFERLFSRLCDPLSPVLGMEHSSFINLVKINPGRAAKELTFTNRAAMFYWGHIPGFGVLVKLSRWSSLAGDIVLTMLRAAAGHEDRNSFRAFTGLLKLFCIAKQEQGGTDVAGAMEELLGKDISEKNIILAIVGEGLEWSYKVKSYIDGSVDFIKTHMTAAIDVYKDLKNDAKQTAYWAELLFCKAGCTDVQLMLELLKHKSKVVGKLAAEIIGKNESAIRPLLEEMLPSLKGDTLDKAKGIIKKWDNERKYGADFSFTSNELVEEFVSENYDKTAEKKISFIPEECFAGIRYADLSGTASPQVMKYIMGEYMRLEAPYKIAVCSKLADKLYAPDLHNCIENIYQIWLENGADTKLKMVTVPYCVFASDVQILAMKKQLLKWAEASRGALASFVINAIAVNGGSTALMMVNDIAAKFPNNMVKKAAKAAFSFAAEALGVPIDVLADKIVPNLGLDKNGEAELDYGARTFTVSLMPDFTLSFYDNSKGKAVKSLPKPAADDDAEKAEQAKKYVSDLKKQLKAVTASQKIRLESVFRNGRTWDVSAWNTLFVENPVMHRFARTLIWGVYRDGKLESSFRYSDDGTFCDMNDDEFELPENAAISLVHPIELDAEAISAWTEQLGDYEIIQPFAQITAHVKKLEKDDAGEDFKITAYNGKETTVASIGNAAKKYSLIRSSVEDAGGFRGYHIQDKYLGYGMAINFENLYVGQAYDETVKLEDVYFYKLPEKDSVPDSYNDYSSVDSSEISSRFVSSCLEILESILS